MKQLLTTIIFVLTSILCRGQVNYLDYYVDDYFLQRVFPSGYDIKSGGYDAWNEIYSDTRFVGISGNWKIEIETDKKGKVHVAVYDYIKYPNYTRLPSSVETEIIELADGVLEYSGAKVETKELDINPTGGSRLYYKGIFPSSSIIPLLSISIRASWDHNLFGEVFFNSLYVMYIRTP